MASKVEGDRLKDLTCPLCLDPFSDATFLDCGHTFCKKCLESYVETRNNPDHIVCPVCRKKTKLKGDRVEGLKPNFSVRGLVDALHKEGYNRSSHYCAFHTEVYKDIFCDDCEEFICLTCFVGYHKFHKIHKYEELERECKEKRLALIQKSERRKAHFEEFVNSVEHRRTDIHCHLSNMEQDIRESFEKKVTVLQENKEKLLKKVNDIRKDSDKRINECLDQQKQLIEDFESSITQLTENTDNLKDSDALKALHLQCADLDDSSDEDIDEEAISDVRQTVKSARFCPEDEELLTLGRIEVNKKQKAKKLQARSKVADSNKFQSQDPLSIVRTVDLPSTMSGMAALSQADVVVGYGDKKEGAHRFSLSGEIEPYLDSGLGNVWDIAVQTNGRSVLSHDKKACFSYRASSAIGEGQRAKDTRIQYKCKEGGWYVMLCSGQDNKIYAVNYNHEIYIFKAGNVRPQRIVPTSCTNPSQICVTKRDVIVTSTCDTTPSTVTVFDRFGRAGSAIAASDDNEYLYAAVDSQDRMLVAKVRGGSDVFRLSRYKLWGAELMEEMVFKELTLPHCIDSDAVSYWCYLVSLTPNRVAFANGTHLYFIDLPPSGRWNIWPWSRG